MIGVTLLLGLITSGCFSSGDRSGIGSFDRTDTTQYAVVATVNERGSLAITQQRQVNGVVGDPSLPDAGVPRILRDPFGYKPTSDTTYEMLLAPAVGPDILTGIYNKQRT